MKKTSMLLLALVLTACDKPAPTDTVESLVALPNGSRKWNACAGQITQK